MCINVHNWANTLLRNVIQRPHSDSMFDHMHDTKLARLILPVGSMARNRLHTDHQKLKQLGMHKMNAPSKKARKYKLKLTAPSMLVCMINTALAGFLEANIAFSSTSCCISFSTHPLMLYFLYRLGLE